VIPQQHAARIAQATGAEVLRASPLSGGSIARAFQLTLSDGARLFYKTAPGGMFPAEARGLRELHTAGELRVPRVVAVGPDFLAQELVPTGRRGPRFSEDFGRGFARLHRHSAACFGFDGDNFIGATPQPNPQLPAGPGVWAAWYWEHRLLFQLRLAERQGRARGELSQAMARLEPLLPALLAGSDEPPSLLHGDLWGGNYLVEERGAAVLIDPAVYYGHREADLAMTSLFGGFSEAFYRAYQQEWPLPPGWRRRVGLYQLYHVLNHLNLFGGGYGSQAVAILREYS